jgi:glycosyltransferase involved in cell wall biosynthesis
MGRLRFERPINWVFNPAAAPVAGTLGEQLLIYYCVDEYAAFSGVDAVALAGLERDLLARADLVFTSAQRLYRTKLALNPSTSLVRHGVDHAHFSRATDPDLPVPDEIARLPRPVIGYFGLIAQDWIDLDLLAHVAQSFPRASLVMLGKVTMDVSRLRALPNVHLLGRKPYQSLPHYCRGFDAAVIPFPVNEATLNANPLKAREYLAAGLPVVSTAIPEVEALGRRCRIGRDPDEFVRQLAAALEDPGPQAWRSREMESESWEARLREIERLVAARMPARAPAVSLVTAAPSSRAA